MKRLLSFLLVSFLIFTITGCSLNIYGRRKSDVDKIGKLSEKVKDLEELRKKDLLKLEAIKEALASKLKGEISRKEIKVELAKRGVVITFVDKILFDSGKADIKDKGLSALNKVVSILKRKAKDRDIGIEGHTDNVPITHSGWKSNWELSTARATSILHYLEDKGKIKPERLSATGYGEHRPVALNNTEDGRSQNRRVEIILIPKQFEKVGLLEEEMEVGEEIK